VSINDQYQMKTIKRGKPVVRLMEEDGHAQDPDSVDFLSLEPRSAQNFQKHSLVFLPKFSLTFELNDHKDFGHWSPP
jgi:hypothetical protein